MTNRIVLVATAGALLASLAMTAIANGRTARHRHGVRRARLATDNPDQVVQWNQELQKVLAAPGAQPASIHPTRTLAITHIAVYDAVNGIRRGGEPLVVNLDGPRSASAEAAVTSAARTALDALLPSQQSTIDAFFHASRAKIGSDEHVKRGVLFGERVATAVLAARANDGAAGTPPVFTPGSGPGEYRLTPPTFAPAAFTQTPHVTPFALETASQFRPAPPPTLTSPSTRRTSTRCTPSAS